MEENQELFEKIEAYLSGTLKGDALKTFEAEIVTDQSLKNEVELHRQLKMELDDLETLQFQEKLIKINTATKEKSNKTTPKAINWYAIAATFTGILVTGLMIYLLLNTSSNEIYNEYYKPYAVQDISRGQSNSEKYGESFKLYNNKQYKQAITGFIALSEEASNTDDEVLLYLGNCYMNTDNFEMAIATFQLVEEESSFHTPSLWYLALSYLRQGDKNNAMNTLNKLISEHTIYDRPAKDLLKELTE